MKTSDDLVIARDRAIEKNKTAKKNLKRFFSAPPRLRGELASSVSGPPDFSPCLRASVVNFFLRVAHTIRAALREIFDESAYDRFLQRTGASHSAESYRAFMRDRESTMAQKPRCC